MRAMHKQSNSKRFKGFTFSLRIPALILTITLGFCIIVLTTNFAVKTLIPRQKVTVVIDAGHGGVDSGVCGIKSGVKESDINLKIALIVADRLNDIGINAVLTRKNEKGLYGEATGDFKIRDFEKRKEIIKNAAPSALVSIHQNFYSSSVRRGSQVFFDLSEGESKILADIMQKTFNARINSVHSGREYSALAGDYYILKCTSVPSVIVECGFLSNPADEALLLDDDFKNQIADCIITGIIVYLVDTGEYMQSEI